MLTPRCRTPAVVAAIVVSTAIVGAAACATTKSDSGRTGLRADSTISTSAAPSTSTSAERKGSTTAPASSATTAPRRPARGPEITIAFAGDNNGEGLPEADMANAMAGRLSAMKDLLSRADLTVANLETALTDRGEGARKEFTFRSPPSILNGLQAVGVDVVSMANNHGLDFGPDGLEDSLEAKRRAPIPVVGIGANDAEAFAPARFTVKGLRIAVIGATQVLDASLITSWTATATHGGLASAKRVDRLVAEVKRARSTSDIVIVFLHWGTEKNECPNPAQKQLARTLAEAGTTLIIGGHAHRVQSGGYLGQSFVDYGLGNFGFHASSPDAAHTGVLMVTMQGRTVKGYAWSPGLIRDAKPEPLTGAAADQAVDTWNRLRACTDLTAAATRS
jgi:poly-gamma-glutamate synthesis protein (capsule biosynthesis protein)